MRDANEPIANAYEEADEPRSRCPIKATVEVLGERLSQLVLRDTRLAAELPFCRRAAVDQSRRPPVGRASVPWAAALDPGAGPAYRTLTAPLTRSLRCR